MASKGKTKAKATKIKQKKWIPIYAPKEFNEQIIGESVVAEPSLLIGRIVSVSLMDITGDPNKQSIYLKFKIIEQKSNGVGTESVGYYILLTSSKKRISRSGNKITDSFVTKTADGKIVRVKPFVYTKAYAKGSIIKAIRKIVKETLVKELSKRDFKTAIVDIVGNKIQSIIKESAKKIYPLKVCEIRSFEIEKESKLKKAKLVTITEEIVEKNEEDETPILSSEEISDEKNEGEA